MGAEGKLSVETITPLATVPVEGPL